MEGSKRQADVLADLEEQLSKARKQEKAYEEAMEQLQADLDNMEQDNSRLKQSLNTSERQGESKSSFYRDVLSPPPLRTLERARRSWFRICFSFRTDDDISATPSSSDDYADVFHHHGRVLTTGYSSYLLSGEPTLTASGAAQNVDFELTVPVEGNVEASHLLEQIEALRGTVRFLRTENGYLKGQEMLKEIQALPPLAETVTRARYGGDIGVEEPLDRKLLMAEGDERGEELSDDPSEKGRVARAARQASAGPRMQAEAEKNARGQEREKSMERGGAKGKPSLQALSTESKLLYRELLEYSATPKLVDLGALEQERSRGWTPQRKTAAYQLWERKREGERLRRQVDGLRVQTARLVSIV